MRVEKSSLYLAHEGVAPGVYISNVCICFCLVTKHDGRSRCHALFPSLFFSAARLDTTCSDCLSHEQAATFSTASLDICTGSGRIERGIRCLVAGFILQGAICLSSLYSGSDRVGKGVRSLSGRGVGQKWERDLQWLLYNVSLHLHTCALSRNQKDGICIILHGYAWRLQTFKLMAMKRSGVCTCRDDITGGVDRLLFESVLTMESTRKHFPMRAFAER